MYKGHKGRGVKEIIEYHGLLVDYCNMNIQETLIHCNHQELTSVYHALSRQFGVTSLF